MISPSRILILSLALLPTAAGAGGVTHDVAVGPAGTFTFSPADLTITVGDSVRWTNIGGCHNARADDGSWTSGPPDCTAGWTFTREFPANNVGNNPYFCELHGLPGGQFMAGVIRVVPSISVSDTLVTDGNLGGATATFYVALSAPSTLTVAVSYGTLNGSATAPQDFTHVNGDLVYAPGETLKLIEVPVVSDAFNEGGEEFLAFLSTPSNAMIADAIGIATIRDGRSPKGDFNSDTRVDILWRHDVSGENVVWYMDGATLLTGTFTTPPALVDVNWKMVGATDFNDDGKTDILWRHVVSGDNVVWFMNGSVMTGGTFTSPLADVNWKMVGTGNFNADTSPDILWRHDVSGQNVVWFMNGIALTGGTFIEPLADNNWKMAGTGDFNNDNKVDILWRHLISGENVVWFMDGTTMTGGTFLTPPALTDTNWQIGGTGDYNSDNQTDIVWRHRVAGQNVIWYMNGTVLNTGGFMPTLADVNWRIVGPR